VPGAQPTRHVEITYLWRANGPDLPERERRHGIILAIISPMFAAFPALLGWIWIIDPTLGDFVGVFCVVFGFCALAGLVNARLLWGRGSQPRRQARARRPGAGSAHVCEPQLRRRPG
jgi:hypothetical protein